MDPHDPAHLASGTVIDGRYEILSALGEGGFATVYEAKQLNIGRVVAIKILEIEGADGVVRERFLREAQASARIEHAHVVTIHDFGIIEETGKPYIVMERLRGHDLADELDEHGAMDQARALKLCLDALDALEEAHKQGIVHKDLKPSNLFIVHPETDKESLKVVDFGIARVAQDKRLTRAGQIPGTPQYLAPEYILTQQATPTLDVYQMGLILVEMLTGWPVIEDTDPLRCIHKHTTGALEIPEALQEGAIGPVIKRSLAFDPKDRYADAGQMRRALKAVDPDEVNAPVLYAGRRNTSERDLDDAGSEDLLFGEEEGGRGEIARAETVDSLVGDADMGFEEPVEEVVETFKPSAVKALTLPSSKRIKKPRAEAPLTARIHTRDESPVPKPVARPQGASTVIDRPAQIPAPARGLPRGLLAIPAVLFVIGLIAVIAVLIGSSGGESSSGAPPPDGFALIPADTFQMGSPSDESGRSLVDETRHSVKLTRAFIIQRTEVTQGQWQALIGNNPSGFKNCGPSCPVERVTWFDALTYANALSDAEGLERCYELKECTGEAGAGNLSCKGASFSGLDCKGYRLPTEAEWEYAARGGSDSARHSRLEDIAWFEGNSDERTHPVGKRSTNPWGLQDMIGNVWEWVWDVREPFTAEAAVDPLGGEFQTGERVYRGGSWYTPSELCRAASRGYDFPDHRVFDIGFRIVRTW